jgi:DNA modification methylase
MIELYHGDALELPVQKIPSGSVDLIYTDPPYSQEFHYLYKWLAKEAVRALKPDGFLIAYVGPYWKDVVMNYFNKHLQYFYDFILVHKGNTSILWPRKIISGYKSILCYHLKNRKPLPKTNVLGQWDGTGGDKRFHGWGQDENTARYYIECFSSKGDLVVDYFLGGGTTAEVCKKLDRNFIGFEKDMSTFNIARNRVEGILLPVESRQEIMELKI